MMASISKSGIKMRQIIHKPLISIFSKTLKYPIKLLRDDFKVNGKPTIYVANHVFYEDVAVILCCLRETAYLLLGREGVDNTPKLSERLGLYFNGIVIVDRSSKKSREKAFRNMEKILMNQGNLLLFPEGAWNFHPALLVQKLNWGGIRLAEKTGANIVPIAVDEVNGEYCVIIGGNFSYQYYKSNEEAVEGLRDVMATLVWELIEEKSLVQRKSMTDDNWIDHIREQFHKMPRKSQRKEENFVFKEPNEISLGELLAQIHGIEYCSMAVNYQQYKRIMELCDNWNSSVKIKRV